MTKQEIQALIIQQAVLPLFYHDDDEVCINVTDALYKAGIRTIEFTNRGTNALQNFKKLIAAVTSRWQGLQLGVGTIINTNAAQQFIDAGAAFIISPGVLPAVASTVYKRDMLWVPGCMTATEIIIAKDNGASLIKIFPGSLVGPSYITAIKEIFPDLYFMPTGGVEVTENNLKAWFDAGVAAVGLGSKVITKQALAEKNYKAIETAMQQALQLVKTIKGQ